MGLELATVTDLVEFKPRLYLPTRSIVSHKLDKEKIAIKFCPECGEETENVEG